MNNFRTKIKIAKILENEITGEYIKKSHKETSRIKNKKSKIKPKKRCTSLYKEIFFSTIHDSTIY